MEDLFAIANGSKAPADNKELTASPKLAEKTQILLIVNGLLEPPADGKWGLLSESALAVFKQLRGIKEDALLGKETAKQLINTNPANLVTGFQLTKNLASQIIKFCAIKGYQIDQGEKHYNIVYVEAMDGDGSLNDNAPDTWSARRMVIEVINGVPSIIGNWAATTRPGIYYDENPLNPDGAAFISLTQFKNVWQVGIHGNSCPHEALIQDGTIQITRDRNEIFQRSGYPIESGNDYGINLHGGYDMSYVGRASAGCPAAQSMSGHLDEFMSLMKSDARYQADENYHFSATFLSGYELAKLFPLVGLH